MPESINTQSSNSSRPGDATSPDTDLDVDTGGERFFDISADLNISPVKDEPEEASSLPSVPIQFIRPKPHTEIPSHTRPPSETSPGIILPSNSSPTAPEPVKMPISSPIVATTPPPQVAPELIRPAVSLITKDLPTTPPVPSNNPPAPIPPTAPPLYVPAQRQSLAQELRQEISGELGTKLPPMTEPMLVNPNEPRDPNLKPLRTYESDVAEILARNKTSVASIAVAETKKVQQAPRQAPEAPRGQGSKKTLAVIVSLILVIVGGGGAYYFYSMSPLAPPPAPIETPKVTLSLVPADTSVMVSVDNLTAVSLLTRIRTEMTSQTPNTIKDLVLTKTGASVRMSTTEILDFLSLSVPSILSRSLAAPGMIGLHTNSQGETNAFVVTTSNFSQNTFAGMLQWENVMADDLKLYLFPANIRGVANVTTTHSTSTASTTASSERVTAYPTLRGKFVDRIIRNRDVREFINEDGTVLFLYSFVDNAKLVLTNNEETLGEVIGRLEKAASIR